MSTYQFISNVIDNRTGEQTTSIYRIEDSRVISSESYNNQESCFTRRYSHTKPSKTLVATVPGYIGYIEQQEWIELLND